MHYSDIKTARKENPIQRIEHISACKVTNENERWLGSIRIVWQIGFTEKKIADFCA